MPKKRKSRVVAPTTSIWCFYCDRTFKDESTLVTHQKAKHYRCSACNKKMNTAQGLQVHCEQVHKIKLTGVPGAKEGRENMQIEIFGMAGIPSDVYQGAAPELFRKATKRQVMLGAALVDEKGNLRPSTPTNAAPLMPPLMMPSITPPSHSLLQFVRALPINLTHTLRSRSGNTSLSSTPAPNPSGSYGGLVSSSQVTPLQTSTPLLFPQGSYGTSQPMSESSDVAQASTGARPSSLGATDQKSHQLSGRVGQSVTPFVLSQPSLASGTSLQAPSGKSQFVWKNEELSMEEVRAKLVKYASVNNLA